jgi:hypothetical protein
MAGNCRARERRQKLAAKRNYDPAWVYFAGGAACLGITALYAMFGDHIARSVISFRGIQHIRTPGEIYLVSIGVGVALIAVGVQKVLGSRRNRE